MPFTIAHSVTCRPIARLTGGRLVVPALATGAMAPDFEYLAHLSATRTIGHTFAGVFLLCLPTALVALLLWERILAPVLTQLLRPGTGGLTNGWGEGGHFRSPARVAVVALSIVIGSFSHIAWDAFTHEGGAVVSLWSGFSHNLGPGWMPVYKWLQYGCSVFGLAVLGVWAHRATERPVTPRPAPRAGSSEGSRTRWAVAGAMVGGLLLVGAVGAVQGAQQGDTLEVVKGGIIGALSGTVLSLVLSSVVLRRRLA